MVRQSQKNIWDEHGPGQIDAHGSIRAEGDAIGAIALLLLCNIDQAAVRLSPNRMVHRHRQAAWPPNMLPSNHHASTKVAHQPVDIPITQASGIQALLEDG